MRPALTLFVVVCALLADRVAGARPPSSKGPPGAWCESDKLLASDAAAFDHFGSGSISVSGDAVLVGAYGDDDFGSFSGSAYVFRWSGSASVQEQKLLPDDGAIHDRFGLSVSVSGDTALAGAPLDDDNGGDSGSAYVFRWDGSAWQQEQKLLADDGATADNFGWSVSVSGGVSLVGAHGDDDLGSSSGAAYVVRWNGSAWQQEQKLLASDGVAGDFFGYAVSVSGDVALVGAYGDDDSGSDAGSAYVFRWDGSTWVQEQKLLAPDGAMDDLFGRTVSVSGDVALVGAYGDNRGDSGSAYVFRWSGSAWEQEQQLLSSDGEAGDWFGYSVSVNGDVALVGTYGDEALAGSVYLFTDLDTNGNGVPDPCECEVDLDASGAVGTSDLLSLLSQWGTDPGGPPDFDGDGIVGTADLLALLAAWGPCP